MDLLIIDFGIDLLKWIWFSKNLAFFKVLLVFNQFLWSLNPKLKHMFWFLSYRLFLILMISFFVRIHVWMQSTKFRISSYKFNIPIPIFDFIMWSNQRLFDIFWNTFVKTISLDISLVQYLCNTNELFHHIFLWFNRIKTRASQFY